MTNEAATPEPRKTKRDELVESLELDYVSMALHHSNRAIAERIVDRVMMAGWQWHPVATEWNLDHNMVALPEHKAPTPEQEIELMDRIISGLPIDNVPFIVEEYMEDKGDKIQFEILEADMQITGKPDLHNYEGVKLYDVNSLYPSEYFVPAEYLTPMKPGSNAIYKKQEENIWVRIPDFENYQVNSEGVVRNRWTRRELEVVEDGGKKYVEMHDKDGFSHNVCVDFVMEKVYGE